MIDPLKFARVGPGLSFVSAEALTVRLQAIGVGDSQTARGVVAALGLGSIVTPDGVELFHWEGLVLRLIDVLGRNQKVRILGAARDDTVKVAERVSVSPERTWEDTYSGATEGALLCLMLDEAFGKDGLGTERAVETARLIREVLDVAGRARYGLGERSGEPGTAPGAEPGPADSEQSLQS